MKLWKTVVNTAEILAKKKVFDAFLCLALPHSRSTASSGKRKSACLQIEVNAA